MELVVEVELVVLVVMDLVQTLVVLVVLVDKLLPHLEIQPHLLELLDPLDLFLELIQVVILQVISGSLVVEVVVLMLSLIHISEPTRPY